MKKSVRLLAFFTLFLAQVTATSYAYVPEPQSEGKYFSGKGTRASETYESTAGMPVYEYGKGFQWGPLHLKPTLDYRYHWTDNLFYDEHDTKSDYYHSVRADFLAELPLAGGQHLLSAEYSTYTEWFNRFDSQDHTDHAGTLGLKLNYVPFTLDVENTYERTVSRANTEFTDRIERDENAFHSLLEVPFASFFLENEITDFDIRYERPVDEIFNHNLFTMYQRVGYDMTPATQLLAEYAYIGINYGEVDDRDGDGHQYMFGLRGNLTERLAYQAWAGVQHRIYDTEIRPDFNGLVYRAALQWDPTEINRIILRGDRLPQESTFDGQSFYTRNRADLSWRRQIAERWFLNTRGSVSYNEYSRITFRTSTGEDKTRRDYMWDAGAGLEYRMPNDIVSVVVDYKFTARESNLTGLDYDAGEISAGIRASF